MPTNNLIRQLPMAGRANFLPYQIGADGKPQLALPGILAGAVNAVTAPYRAMNPEDVTSESYDQAQAFNPEQEAADFALNMLGGGTVFGRAPKNALGMNVWHGSPHKFEPTSLNDLGEFNAAKIGTGEGAQAYGHGHYTGEAQATGEGYRKDLSNYEQPFLQYGKTKIAGQNLSDLDLEALKYLETGKRNAGQFPHNTVYYAKQAAKDKPEVLNRLDELGRDVKFGYEVNKGYLYKVDIPDEQIAQMLDWDKPLSEQSESVQAAVKKLPVFKGSEKFLDSGQATGRAIHSYLEDGLKHTPEQVTQLMQQAGIPGIRYLDAGSRGAEGGTSNFVVFPGNENMMTILERNGQAMSPESQAIARYREIKGAKSVVRMEAALRTAGVPLPKNEPVAYIQSLVDRAHRRN